MAVMCDVFQVIPATEQEKFVWLVVASPLKVELKFAITTLGGQCVMIRGIAMMPQWYADNLDYHQCVSSSS